MEVHGSLDYFKKNDKGLFSGNWRGAYSKDVLNKKMNKKVALFTNIIADEFMTFLSIGQKPG